jgi:diguanylate cyclase (GGDEF)-like protein
MDQRDLIELGIGRAQSATAEEGPSAAPALIGADRPLRPRGVVSLSLFLDRLLGVLMDRAPEAMPESMASFREHLQIYRREITVAPPPAGLAATLEGCLKRCDAYLQESHGYHADREAELAEVVAILREGIAAMAGESNKLHDHVLSSSERVGGMLGLDDLRQIRREVSVELAGLRTAVVEKQKRDDAAQAQLAARVTTLQNRLQKAEAQATIDPLTELPNRGHFDRAIMRMMTTASLANSPLSLAMVDVDNFKQINDQHGHQIGDRVIVATGQWLVNAVRHTDLVARYGGEEFAVLMPDAPLGAAETRVRHALEGLSRTAFEYEAGDARVVVRWTASCGVGQLSKGETEASFVRRADEALYEAKRRGKNCVYAKKRSLLAAFTSRAGG